MEEERNPHLLCTYYFLINPLIYIFMMKKIIMSLYTWFFYQKQISYFCSLLFSGFAEFFWGFVWRDYPPTIQFKYVVYVVDVMWI